MLNYEVKGEVKEVCCAGAQAEQLRYRTRTCRLELKVAVHFSRSPAPAYHKLMK